MMTNESDKPNSKDSQPGSIAGFWRVPVFLPLVADALPFFYLLIAPFWPTAPEAVVKICSFAPPVIGIGYLVCLGILRYTKVFPSFSIGVVVGAVFAVIGVIEPIFYWI